MSTNAAKSRSALNRTLAITLSLLVVLAPLPLASHRPVFWALGALIMGLVATLYLWRADAQRIKLTYDPRRLGIWLWLALVYLAYMIVQSLPLTGIFGPFVAEFPQGAFGHDAISLSIGETRLAALRAAGYGLLFLLALQIAVNRGRAYSVAWILFVAILGWALYALLLLVQLGDTILFFEKWAYEGSATGPFVNRNSFATFLAMGVILGTGLLLGDLTRRSRRGRSAFDTQSILLSLAAVGVLIVFVTLLRTQSRMGLFAGLVGLALTVSLIIARRWTLGRPGWFLAVFSTATIAVLGLYLYGGGLVDRLGSLDTSAQTRLSIYDQVWLMTMERPWTGWGANSFEVVFRAFRTDPVPTHLSWELAHSTYLAHWSETGLIFGSIPILLTAAAFIACIRAVLTRDADIVLPAIGAGVILTNAVHALVDFSLEIQANVWMFLIIVALAMANRGPQGDTGVSGGAVKSGRA